MSKRVRQYIGLISAVIAYYVIHEGAHLLYALAIGSFKRINFIGLGVQIDVYAEQMTQNQLGVFCLVGALATMITAYLLLGLIPLISKINGKLWKACMYYITLAFLILDPSYLSILCSIFGGGDMNGIKLLLPEVVARIAWGILLIVHLILIVKIVIPKYKKMFETV